jgi:hypothetical protein
MTGDQMRAVQQELGGVLIAKGRTPGDADQIVQLATQAAQEAIQRLIAVVGTAPEAQRDVAIVLAINIMERLALSGYGPGKATRN